eukprot:TRINITY_DN24551_c0_g1_i1.p1 TRINITY_DN24551_c0_g1~~TRINITY_DN24551_c0_g1_i1.p1  ORF type:complete len:373 (+),score=72.82 TRINITY_DN24551_c0_g1_i1:166-1284(+)
MDGNKDEGTRCYNIGKAALERGDLVRAEKFLMKAKKLYPNAQVDALLRAILEETGRQGSEETVSENGHQRQRAPAEDDAASSASHDSRADRHGNGVHSNGSSASGPTIEQVEIVRRVTRTKDFYEILGVARSCTEEDVRKAYRKLSLKVHPDKNKARGAEDAFKAVSKAFTCLSSADRRAKYDQNPEAEDGTEAVQQHPFMRRRNGGSTMYYEDIFEANDVFNTFFFGMQNQNGPFRRAHFVRTQDGRGPRTDAPSTNLLGLLQLLPIIALFALTYFPFSQPVFSLHASSPYTTKQMTKDYGVPYFVKSSSYDKEYPVGSSSRRSIEKQAEREYTEILAHNCRTERRYRQWGQKLSENSYCAELEKFGVRVY